MTWSEFPLFAASATLLWIAGIIIIYAAGKSKSRENSGIALVNLGIAALALFIVLFWINLDRPPLRTLGETRLWYSFFLPLIGIITYLRWRYKWFLLYAIALAVLFLFINYIKPEIHDKTLMPALQSPWFVPHVVVYIFAYALLAASSLVGVKGLYEIYYREYNEKTLKLGDNMVYAGFSFLTLGLIFGALWAKVAWGHYWTWDPKETWAFLTWFGYLIYMHFRHYQPKKVKAPYWTLSLAFIILLICWFGINYLPSAQNSVHVYSR